MHRIVLVLVLALAAVPAAFAADSPSPSSQASALCKQQRTALGAKDFASLYGGNKNAYGRCVSKLAGSVQSDTANAAKQCAAERADTAFAGAHGGKTFDQYYGTGKNGKDAFGKCVSAKAKAQTDAKQQATLNAAKSCKAERTQMGAAPFTQKYGGHSNAFGKCVSKATRAG
jgi:hypothetical protein